MTKLEETLAQFMQVSMSNQKSTESTIKNLEVQVEQWAKQLEDRSSRSFGANTEKNPKEECKAVMTRSKVVSFLFQFFLELPKPFFHSLTVAILKITNFSFSLSEHGALSIIPTREGIALSEQERAKRATVQWKLR